MFLPDVAVVSFKIETEVFNAVTRHKVPLGNVSCSSMHTDKVSEMIVRDRSSTWSETMIGGLDVHEIAK